MPLEVADSPHWRRRLFALVAMSAVASTFGCKSSPQGTAPPLPAEDATCAGPCPASNIKHVVIVVQENHTFDDHFGGWCQAPAGSNPTCTAGVSCCEAMPATDPAGIKPTLLTDDEHSIYDPPHGADCEALEIDDGKMDAFSNAGMMCGDPQNVAISDPAIMKPLWDIAAEGAVADRYFQPIQGESYANDMYLAQAKYLFADDDIAPAGAVGVACGLESMQETLTGDTIGDLLTAAQVPWTFYAEGYAAMQAADGGCPPKPADCAFPFPFDPCGFEPSDVPFEYFASTRDNPKTMQDFAAFTSALADGGLPAVSFIKALEYKSEHPGGRTLASAGIAFLADLVQSVEESRYRGDTLVLITYDEGGGYFDHVAPPPPSVVDGKAYGTRIPLVAVGPFANRGTVSHVVMEHSSLVRFLEWNFLGGATGQLGGRDAVIANIGSLLDATTTGVAVPE